MAYYKIVTSIPHMKWLLSPVGVILGYKRIVIGNRIDERDYLIVWSHYLFMHVHTK